MKYLVRPSAALAALACSSAAWAATAGSGSLDLTATWVGFCALGILAIAYGFVISEEFLGLRKSKPVIAAAGIIWMLVAIVYTKHGQADFAAQAVRHNLLDFAEIMLFLLSAMTYINTLEERNIFKALRGRLVSMGLSLRAVFWLTGLSAFFISPIADNLTTALIMGAVVLAVGNGYPRFIALACINVVVAANAGGAFSPFGDITTLMVWQKGVARFDEFFALFLPSLVNWLVPALCMTFAVPRQLLAEIKMTIHVKRGGFMVMALFLFTILMTVLLHHFLHLPPFLGMMTGLGLLKFYGYFIRRGELRHWMPIPELGHEALTLREYYKPAVKPFDIFISMKRAEWDTLMFFYGVVLCVGGVGALGYLALLSETLYVGLGPTPANILIGLASAIIDNVPIMFAILSMAPDMDLGQWLLVTLTAGVGGSVLSIGSAAGVALMGQARDVYTFFAHLRWSWAVALGYAAGIGTHFLINESLFK